MSILSVTSFCAVVATVMAVKTGRCPHSNYMSVSWGGMSKEACLKRAYEVNQGPGPSGQCGHVSYSASAAPQKSTNFCQCHSSCEEPLEQLSGEQWETYVVSENPSMSNSASNAGIAGNADSNNLVTSGRCPGSSYMNIAWGGMTKQKCLERAYEVNEGPGPSGRCGHVSYSASAAPQQQSNFCQCHSSCEKPLDMPKGEKWETHVVSAQSQSHISSGYRHKLSISCALMLIASSIAAIISAATFD
jgi:hypothetical protein